MGSIAYFSMEIGVRAEMPTYAGGLGVLAGDTLRSAADLGVPLVGVTLLHRKGYFRQRLESRGRQSEDSADWSVDTFLTERPERVAVTLESQGFEGRPVAHFTFRVPAPVKEKAILVRHRADGSRRRQFAPVRIAATGARPWR